MRKQPNLLEVVRKKRGYLLSYHLSLAAACESLSFALLHCGGPTMLAAMACWIETARKHPVPAPFRRNA